MEKILQDRVALVTGGAQGLGQAICWRLAQEGCHVVVADLNEEKAVETAAAKRGQEKEGKHQGTAEKQQRMAYRLRWLPV